MGTYKITNLGVGTAAADAVRFSQLQNFSTSTLITVSGTDTITGTVSPTLTAYAAGQIFSFVVAATNTTSVTLNIDAVGVKAITRTGAIALAAGDMVTGQIALIEYDGTRFQLLDPNAFTNLRASGTLGVTGLTTLGITGAAFPGSTSGTATIVATAIAGSSVLTLPVATDTLVGKATTDTLTNKTLTSPVIASIVNTGTLTLPTSTDTLVGKATTDTLTNKTLTSPTLTTPNINSAPISTVTGAAPLFMARAWVNFNGTGTIAIRASGNVTSLTDNGAGDYTVNLTTAMPDANYAVVCNSVLSTTASSTGSAGPYGSFAAGATTKTTAAIRTEFGNSSTGTLTDTAEANVVIFR